MANYIETVTGKRQQAAIVKALRGDTKQDRQIVVATNNGLLQSITALTDKTVKAIAKLDSSSLDKQELIVLHQLKQSLDTMQKSVDSYITAIDRQTIQLVAAMNKLQRTDTPVAIQKTSEQPSSITLSDYRAHDIDTAPDGKQYIGFMNGDGKWYIVESDDRKNTMRYYFGNGDYATAWSERYSHTYGTLSEALHGVAA